MSISDQRTNLRLLTVGDFDPQADQAIEYDFIGRVIAGRYTVRAHIGGGGMADVFQATDEELGVDVAIKLLKPRMASDELRARMVQEARAAAQVRHPNVVRVFSTGKLDRTAYIVMELLDGPNLEQYLREHHELRLPWKQALALMLPAMEGLHAIHERGYIHRDIKAGNILITRQPGCPPTAFVIDLGLVKANPALRTADSPPTTEIGRLLCTPSYASPEQAAGLPLDRRSDVYSMAVTLYRVLAGRLPFHDARGQPVMVVLSRHVYNEPTMLAAAAAGAEIPPALAEVVESALRKSPDDRPQTMLAFAESLRAAAARTATAVTPRAAPRRRQPYDLLLSLGVGVVATLLATSRPAMPPPASREPPPEAPMASAVDTRTVTAGLMPATPPPAAVPADSPAVAPGTAPASESRTSAPAASPPVNVTGPEPPVSAGASAAKRRPTMKVTWHRVLAQRAPGVQRCVDQATTGSLERLAVVVNIDVAGRVSAHAQGAPNNPLSRCLNAAFKDTLLTPPREPASIVHIFQLRATPDP